MRDTGPRNLIVVGAVFCGSAPLLVIPVKAEHGIGVEVSKWLGIDFSGDVRRWGANHTNSNVWIATIERDNKLVLSDLRAVQELEGDEHPFQRLINLLREKKYNAAAIDAPFSVPARFVPRNHKSLLKKVIGLDNQGRPFPAKDKFYDAVTGQLEPLQPPKPLRLTESFWSERRVNVRSTLWNHRVKPGTSMTAACLKLLGESACDIWPWSNGDVGLLIEAFPAAQLSMWNLPYQQYNGPTPEAEVNRKTIFNYLSRSGLSVGSYAGILVENADALDAVICAFAAIAVTEGNVRVLPPDDNAVSLEGWISVHNGFPLSRE